MAAWNIYTCISPALDPTGMRKQGFLSLLNGAEAVKQQTALDLNGDGVVTAQEVQQAGG